MIAGDLGGCDSIHSLASEIALLIVSSGVNFCFSKSSWFLAIHSDQTIQAARVPGPRPIEGRVWIFLTCSHPSRVELNTAELITCGNGASFQTDTAKGQVKSRCDTVSSALHRAHRVET